MSVLRVIKRYTNRKLYDTQHSRYVTLEHIAEMIREGDDVKIIDNKTKADLTSVTLAQIILEKEKKQKSFLPLQAMRYIIQSGGESIHQLILQAQRKVTEILPLKEENGFRSEEVNISLTEAGRSGPPAIRELREFLAVSHRTLEVWSKHFEERVRNVVVGISPFRGLHRDVQSLSTRISELEAKLSTMVDTDDESAPPGDSSC